MLREKRTDIDMAEVENVGFGFCVFIRDDLDKII